MRSKQILYLLLIVCTYVCFSTAAPTDASSQSEPVPIETPGDRVPILGHLSQYLSSWVDYLLGSAPHQQAASSKSEEENAYRSESSEEALKGEYVLGSANDYAQTLKDCNFLKSDLKRAARFDTIYITDKFFTQCRLNPTLLPSLKRLYMKLVSFEPIYWRNVGFVDMIEATMDPRHPFKLEVFSTANPFGFGREAYTPDWFNVDWIPFLIDHLDWDAVSNPFRFWDHLLQLAVDHQDMTTKLFEFAKTKSYLVATDPFTLEAVVAAGNVVAIQHYKHFVNHDLLDGLLLVKSRNFRKLIQWSKNENPPSMLARVLFFAMECEADKKESKAGTDMIKLLAGHARLNENFRNDVGESLLGASIRCRQWSAFDMILLKPTINVNAPTAHGEPMLLYAMYSRIDLDRFKKLLDKGAKTIADGPSPLLLALTSMSYSYAELMIQKRFWTDDSGKTVVELTREENEFFLNSEEARKMVFGYDVRIIEFLEE